jgi:hypothetical protein
MGFLFDSSLAPFLYTPLLPCFWIFYTCVWVSGLVVGVMTFFLHF